MKVVIKSAEIIDPGSGYHGQVGQLVIQDGIIKEFTSKNARGDIYVEGQDLKVSPGWFDLQAHFCDPGNEQAEDQETGRIAAASGGFTGVAIVPNTDPPIHQKNHISYYTRLNQEAVVEVFPIASLSARLEGLDINEFADLHKAGAIAFSEGLKPIQDAGVLLRALQYVQVFDGLIMSKPESQSLSRFGVMNEGEVSTRLGMPGIPALAEVIMVQRDLTILGYTGGRLHFSNISVGNSVELIKEARKAGFQVTCDVPIQQLAFTDEALDQFETNFKVNPPLREKTEQKALINYLKSGDIQTVVSSHQPHVAEDKLVEFDHAAFGMLGLQVVLPILLQHFKPGFICGLLAENSRKILGLPVPAIKENATANLTVFSPTEKWILNGKTNQSKSVNTPFWDRELTGRVIAVLNNGQIRTN